MTETLADAVRPSWRGRIHRYAAVVAVPLFVVLVTLPDSASVRLACAVYGIGVTTMLAVSAIYHSAGVSPATRRRLQRADHSTILLAIAGSYTAVSVLALNGAPERRLLVFVWVAAIVGIAVRMTWLDAPYPIIAAVYLAVGWSALLELNALLAGLTNLETALIIGGGCLYTVGAVVYALHRPNPWPAVFGYHELFHALVVAAAAMHYVAVVSLVTRTT